MRILMSLILLISNISYSQDANKIIKKSVQLFTQVKSYSNDVSFVFNIPGIHINDIAGKAYYNAPNKYRIKTAGVAFIPNENPMKLYGFLKDSSYNAVYNSKESVSGHECHLVNIIPNKETYFILGKIWISASNSCIYKVELTTSSGLIKLENSFKSMIKYALPDKMVFYIDNANSMRRRRIGMKSKSTEDTQSEEKGTITMTYSNYQINIPIADSLFLSPKKLVSKK